MPADAQPPATPGSLTLNSLWRVGVDTGGTFTDLVLVDPDGIVRLTHKLLSTPDNPSLAVRRGLDHLLDRWRTSGGEDPGLPQVVHGSTVATNALLEGAGERAALLTTAGFEDVLAIARQDRPELYALVPKKRDLPIAREMTFGVEERMAYDGEVLRPLAQDEVRRVIQRLVQVAPRAVVICLLHSYVNPAHEQKLADAVAQALPDAHLTVSHELLPEFREYERTATCAVNGVVGPRMSRYIGQLDQTLGEGRLRIMGTGGGTLPPGVIARRPVETIMSGPAGGVIGAMRMAQGAGESRVIGFDMGGTSTDVSLCDGRPSYTTAAHIAGLPVHLPMIDIHTVGAGGGSIAWLDAGGALRVGPRSAGADPGPACYGQQQGEPIATVTDAHVVLGHLSSGRQLGESLRVDARAADHAIDQIAALADMTRDQMALGILKVAEATMARAVQRISVERGYDPRAFTLLAFGGAGGLHACRLAQLLGMTRVLVPAHGGLLSAVGMLGAPVQYTFAHAAFAQLNRDETNGYPDPCEQTQVRRVIDQLKIKADGALADDNVPALSRRVEVQLDLRFVGQSHELTVATGCVGGVVAGFVADHQRLYGYAPTGRAIEVIAARVLASGTIPDVRLAPRQAAEAALAADGEDVSLTGRGDVQREQLSPGDRCHGPCVIEEYSATTVIPEGWQMEVLADGQLLLTR